MTTLWPRVKESRTFAVALIGLGIGVVILVSALTASSSGPYPWFFSAHYDHTFIDVMARRAQVGQVQHGVDLFLNLGVEAFTYPPAALFLFWPLVWIPVNDVPFLWTLLTLLCLSATLVCTYCYLRPTRGLLVIAGALWAVPLCVVLFPPIDSCLAEGQTGTILVLLLAADFLSIRGKGRGILVGVATAFKLYPGVFIVYWLWRRRWREAWTAISTVVVLWGAAWLLWPVESRGFFLHSVFGGGEMAHFQAKTLVYIEGSSVYATFYHFPFHRGPLASSCAALASILVLVCGIVGAGKLSRQGLELSALLILCTTSVLITPNAWVHYFTFAPLLVLAVYEARWERPFGQACALAALVMMFPWVLYKIEINPDVLKAILGFVARNAVLGVSLLLILVAFFDGRSKFRPAADAASLDSVHEDSPI